jgi:hypothetical protein
MFAATGTDAVTDREPRCQNALGSGQDEAASEPDLLWRSMRQKGWASKLFRSGRYAEWSCHH